MRVERNKLSKKKKRIERKFSTENNKCDGVL